MGELPVGLVSFTRFEPLLAATPASSSHLSISVPLAAFQTRQFLQSNPSAGHYGIERCALGAAGLFLLLDVYICIGSSLLRDQDCGTFDSATK
ncbi:hypothetical protein M8818_006083 [Zalaria obscura]|uniref:Uncharacterized protein n=1 Tax=Zalaria obscura TaxID=2024903 RepID=A0ACC3S7T4_9PEZI